MRLLLSFVFLSLVTTKLYATDMDLKASDALVQSFLVDAKGSAEQADLYRAYKFYQYLYQSKREFFYKKAMPNYISVSAELFSKDRFDKICEILVRAAPRKGKAAFSCAREFLREETPKRAIEYLTLVKKNEPEFFVSQILLASAHLMEGNVAACLKTLPLVDRKKYELKKLSDLFFVTRARCQVRSSDLEQAVFSYQAIPSSSAYYFEALEELSWLYFKQRNKDACMNTSQVVVSAYGGNNEERKSQVGANTYFKTKYLQAYMDLVLQSGTKEKQKFSELYEELKKYRDEKFQNKNTVNAAIQEIQSATQWNRLAQGGENFHAYMDLISQWMDVKVVEDLKDQVRWYLSIKFENARFQRKIYTENKEYKDQMARLEIQVWKDLKQQVAVDYDLSKRYVNSFLLKLKISEKDFFNLKLTEGIKNLDEATALYQERENILQQKMGEEL